MTSQEVLVLQHFLARPCACMKSSSSEELKYIDGSFLFVVCFVTLLNTLSGLQLEPLWDEDNFTDDLTACVIRATPFLTSPAFRPSPI